MALLAAAVLPRAYDAQRLAAAAAPLGPRAVAGARAMQQLIAAGSQATDDSRVRATNQFFNDAFAYADDMEIWGQKDYWATPLEAFSKGMADCEDYAIAKYFSLAAMGMPTSKLRMVYVRAQINGPGTPGVAHMVLAYYPVPGAEPLILDNLVPEVRLASQRPDLSPVFSFNTEGLWQGVTGAASGDPAARLSRWRELLEKLRAEGLL
ncbi:transglutaminase-like cysteine peptidase [Piscinibacter sakaiensis]|uniref:FIGfam010717 protein n=1 Tax=Piscinibacter sakaiensis TaxID=1547922 RepID=A0A0K8P8T9_PISS1|nr:transglutaminase-like cysteine peptidase [Piscinibacter sakaiensis]GAP39051.1 FIGfam010717 protein [Piscinibacter sakaiensis]